MGSKRDKLPGILAEIEDVAGRENALTIAQIYGGQNKKFPTATAMAKSPQQYGSNWLVLAIGYEVALKVVQELCPGAGISVEIPFARQAIRRDFIRENSGKLSHSEMAISLNVTERTVRRINSSLAGNSE